MRRALSIIILSACAVAAQQPSPDSAVHPEDINLARQVRDLQRKVADLEDRLKAVESNQRYRVTPLTER